MKKKSDYEDIIFTEFEKLSRDERFSFFLKIVKYHNPFAVLYFSENKEIASILLTGKGHKIVGTKKQGDEFFDINPLTLSKKLNSLVVEFSRKICIK